MSPVHLAEFDAGAISSDGGMILLHEVARRIKLLDRVNQLIPDPRDPLHMRHDQRTLISQGRSRANAELYTAFFAVLRPISI